MNKKLILSIILLIILGSSLAAGIYLVQRQQPVRPKAAPATTLTLEPSTSTPAIGDTFTVDILIDTGGNQVQTAELYLSYDAGPITAQSISAGPYVSGPTILSQSVSASALELTLLIPYGQNPGTSGTLATMTFSAVGAGSATISFDAATQILALDEQGNNVLASQPSPLTVTVASAQATATPIPTDGQAAPTATPTPALSPTPTPTPTPDGGVGGGILPTNTPIPTPTPTARQLSSGGGDALVLPTTVPQELPVAGGIGQTFVLLGSALSIILFGLLLL